MNLSDLNFNATTEEKMPSRDLIPEGKYLAIIEASERKDSKTSSGKYLELVFQLIAKEVFGRKMWLRLNLWNQNATAVALARAELAAICIAVSKLSPKDSSELHNLPLVVQVGIKARKDNGEKENYFKGFYADNGTAALENSDIDEIPF